MTRGPAGSSTTSRLPHAAIRPAAVPPARTSRRRSGKGRRLDMPPYTVTHGSKTWTRASGGWNRRSSSALGTHGGFVLLHVQRCHPPLSTFEHVIGANLGAWIQLVFFHRPAPAH